MVFARYGLLWDMLRNCTDTASDTPPIMAAKANTGATIT
eukprot:gene14727-biopygen16882